MSNKRKRGPEPEPETKRGDSVSSVSSIVSIDSPTVEEGNQRKRNKTKETPGKKLKIIEDVLPVVTEALNNYTDALNGDVMVDQQQKDATLVKLQSILASLDKAAYEDLLYFLSDAQMKALLVAQYNSPGNHKPIPIDVQAKILVFLKLGINFMSDTIAHQISNISEIPEMILSTPIDLPNYDSILELGKDTTNVINNLTDKAKDDCEQVIETSAHIIKKTLDTLYWTLHHLLTLTPDEYLFPVWDNRDEFVTLDAKGRPILRNPYAQLLIDQIIEELRKTSICRSITEQGTVEHLERRQFGLMLGDRANSLPTMPLNYVDKPVMGRTGTLTDSDSDTVLNDTYIDSDEEMDVDNTNIDPNTGFILRGNTLTTGGKSKKRRRSGKRKTRRKQKKRKTRRKRRCKKNKTKGKK